MRAGLYNLCYKWKYAESVDERVTPTPYIRFPNVQVLALEIAGATPRGTTLSCETIVTIQGAGFDLIPAELPISCEYGLSASRGVTSATVKNGTQLTCPTPLLSTVEPMSINFVIGQLKVLFIMEAFAVIDVATLVITNSTPSGAPYNTQMPLVLRGSGFVNFGGGRCKFDDSIMTTEATVHSPHLVECYKPEFPSSERDRVGQYTLRYSPNGQCWPSPTAQPQGVTSFTTYNALLSGLTVIGAPSSKQVEIGLEGLGFVDLGGGTCTFTSTHWETAGMTIIQPLTVVSSTAARCLSPGGGIPNVAYTLETKLNGVTPVPTFGLGGSISFTEYDLAQVRVASIYPKGFPTSTQTAITLKGSGFATYGQGQLVCQLTDWTGAEISIPGTLLGIGATRSSILCPFYTGATPTTYTVRLSLNGGSAGTFSSDTHRFSAYEQAVLYDVTPRKGDANGGNVVTISGRGFTGLAPLEFKRQQSMRRALHLFACTV